MTAAYASVGGEPATSVTVHVPPVGPWFAEVELEGDPDLSGAVTIALGELELEGTVDARHTGTHGIRRRMRIVGGGGGWSTMLAAKAYHADNGVQARTVVEDAAREAGEELGGTFEPASTRLAADYVRQTGLASRVLEDAIGAAQWWVDYDGRTQVGARSSSTPAETAYEVLDYAPDERLVTLAVDDLRSIVIGSVLSEGLDEAQTVRELELVVGADAVRVKAWCGGAASSRGRLGDLLWSIVSRATDGRLFGLWRYRVVRMSGDRLELQAVRQGAGLPDILPISMWPGVAGVHAEPALGAEVLVGFIEGDRTMPIVTHFAGKDGVGFVPQNVTHDVQTLIKVGAAASEFAAKAQATLDRLTAIVNGFNGHTHSYTAPSSGGSASTTGTPATPLATPASVAASKVKVE